MPAHPIKEILNGRPFVCVDASTQVRAVTRMMAEQRCSGALITTDGVLAGIFTERDATFRVLAAGLDPDATPVSEVMTVDPMTLTEERPFGHALHMMYENQVRHIPIVTGGRIPVGIVTARDALSLDALAFSEELVLREEITTIL
ncbi:CBS domain-containing protein [Rhodocyclaceae bacterium SMB388]